MGTVTLASSSHIDAALLVESFLFKRKRPPHCGGPKIDKPNTLGAELAGFLSIALPSQRLFDSFLLARFQIEGMFLQILDDILLLDLAFETAKRAFQGFTLLHYHFSQKIYTSSRL